MKKTGNTMDSFIKEHATELKQFVCDVINKFKDKCVKLFILCNFKMIVKWVVKIIKLIYLNIRISMSCFQLKLY